MSSNEQNTPKQPIKEHRAARVKAKGKDDGKLKPVRVGQTVIPIYRLKRRGFQARYYVAGVPKRITSASEAKLRAAVEEKAHGIENGRVQAGDLSAADVQGYYHAVAELQKMGTNAPPLHVALAEYVSAKSLLPEGMSLAEAVRLLLQTRPLSGSPKPVTAVIDELLASLADSRANVRYERGIRNDLRTWAATLPAGATLDRVSVEDLRTYLRGLKDRQGTLVGARRRDNVRDEIVTLFRYARSNRYLPEDRQTEAERVKRIKPVHEIGYYTPEQLCAFLAHVEPAWLPWMALGAFAGLRSSEVVGDPDEPNRERLRWSDLRWESNCIIVPKTVARKIKRPRRVPLRLNLQAWLLPWRNASGYIYPKVRDQSIETARLATATKLEWLNNGLRHSYATYRMAEVGNAGQVAEEMGTSIGRIKENYDAVPADIDPEIYFSLEPDAAATGRILDMLGRPV